jgi:hypothetical protein
MELQFSRQIWENSHKNQISRKSVQWEPSCSTWTELTKLIAAFLTFANAPHFPQTTKGNNATQRGSGNEAIEHSQYRHYFDIALPIKYFFLNTSAFISQYLKILY